MGMVVIGYGHLKYTCMVKVSPSTQFVDEVEAKRRPEIRDVEQRHDFTKETLLF